MKKVLLTILVAASLVACNNKKDKIQEVTAAAPTTEAGTSQNPANDAAGESTPQADGEISSPQAGTAIPSQMNSPRSPEETAKQIEALKAASDYVPSGDINKDAQDLVEMQLALAQKASEGKDTQAENNKVTAVMHILGEYYHNKGLQDEFQKLLGVKLQSGIEKIKAN